MYAFSRALSSASRRQDCGFEGDIVLGPGKKGFVMMTTNRRRQTFEMDNDKTARQTGTANDMKEIPILIVGMVLLGARLGILNGHTNV